MKTILRVVLGLFGVVLILLAIEFALGPVTVDNLISARLIHKAAARNPPDESVVFKETPTRPLSVHVFRAEAGRGPGATVVLIHGGGFHSGWPDELFPLASRLAEVGHTVFVPEYRLQRADGVTYPAEFDDCRDAVDWVARNAGDYDARDDVMVLGGSSAGAHLAAAIVTLEDPEGRPAPELIGLVLTAPYLDSAGFSERLRSAPPQGGPITRLLGAKPEDVFEGVSERYSPREHLHPGLPPMLVLVGEEDPLWPPAREFCDAVRALGVDCQGHAFPGATHGFALEGLPDHEAVVEAVRERIGAWTAARDRVRG